MSIFYLDYIAGNDATTATPLGWWSASVVVVSGSAPVADEVMTGAISGSTAKLTVAPASWSGTVTCYFYARSAAFQAETVNFAGGGVGTITADLIYCPWKDITTGATAARITPGDTMRERGDIANLYPGDTTVLDGSPQSIGNATWTKDSATVTLAGAQTLNIDLCSATGTAVNQWDATGVTGVSTGTNTASHHEGSQCIILTIGDSAAVGKLAWCDLNAINLSTYKYISFWIRSSITIPANYLKFQLCDDTDGGTVLYEFTIPYILQPATSYPVTLRWDGGADAVMTNATSISSVAVYMNTDFGACTIIIDNIMATNGLNLQSLIGKGDADGWWSIKSINSDSPYNVILGRPNQVTTVVSPYYTNGTSPETVATYRRETIKTTLTSSSSAPVQAPTEAGTMAAPYIYDGGYSIATNLNTNGLTCFDGLICNGSGFDISNNARAWITVKKILAIRYYSGFTVIGASYGFSCENCAAIACAGIGFSVASTLEVISSCFAMQCPIGISGPGTSFQLAKNLLTSCKALGNTVGVYGGHTFVDLIAGGNSYDVELYLTSSILLINPLLASTEICTNQQSSPRYGSFASIMDKDNSENNHVTYYAYGSERLGSGAASYWYVSYDAVLYKTTTPSRRVTPNHATLKAESSGEGSGICAAVDKNGTVTYSVWVRKSVSYNGAQPRLILRKNYAASIDAEQVLDTATYEIMTLDVAPGTNWSPGATITGASSGKTCVIVEMHTTLIYTVKDRNGTFTLGEILSDGTYTADQGGTKPTFAVKGYDDTTVSKDWELLTGTTTAVTEDAVLEAYVDCDGTAGFICIDDWGVA